MSASFFCALILSAGTLLAQTVDGTVTNSVTHAGIGGVKVSLTGHGLSEYSAETDDRGKFLIEGVPEGVYSAQFSSPGFLSARNGAGIMVFVLPGSNPVHLKAEMIPWGKISGRVTDGRGDPVPSARIELTRPGIHLIWPTDGKGTFTMDRLVLPGTYTLAAVPPQGWKAPDSDGGRPFGWVRTYYPGTAHSEEAAKIMILPGVELGNIEIKLAAAPAHAIRGTIFNSDGTPASKAAVHLGDSHETLASAQADSDGAWEFPAIVDGEWRLFADSENDGVRLKASQWVQLRGQELKGAQLRFSPPGSLSGRVIVEVPVGAPPLPPLRIALTPHAGPGFTAGSPIGLPSARSGPDGNFLIENLYPGSYRVGPPLPVPPYYLDSIRLGDLEVLGQEVELPSAAPLTLTYKTNGGAVRGTVEACGAGSVLLVPQNSALWRAASVHSEQCGVNGRFEIVAVKPGEYYAMAVANVPATMFFPVVELEPELIRQASKVTIRAGETSQLDLRIIGMEY